jgi:hypothetical protein
MQACTLGETCEGNCNTRGLRLECACPASGEYLCQTTMCTPDGGASDGGADGGTPTCQAGTGTGDNCDPQTDDLCETQCSSGTRMNRTCLCSPVGSGQRGQWACTANMACTP